MNTLAVCPKCQAMNRVDLERAEGVQPVCGKCKTELPLHHGIQELSDSTLRALVEKSSRPVVVDFWAPWCGPCRAFAPTFQRAAQDLGDRLVFAKVNTEAIPQAGAAFGIRGIPSLLVFKNGREVDRQSGALPLPALKSYLNRWV